MSRYKITKSTIGDYICDLYFRDYDLKPKKTYDTPKIIFDKNATTLIMNDGSRYTVKAHGEQIDHEKGLAMVLAKYIFTDSEGNWHNQFNRVIEKAESEELHRIVGKAMRDIRKVYSKTFEKAFSDAVIERVVEDGKTPTKSYSMESAADILTVGTFDECYELAHKKALKTVMRSRKRYISDETGLDQSKLDEALKDAINTYSQNRVKAFI